LRSLSPDRKEQYNGLNILVHIDLPAEEPALPGKIENSLNLCE
jgi:hypothetical protein